MQMMQTKISMETLEQLVVLLYDHKVSLYNVLAIVCRKHFFKIKN